MVGAVLDTRSWRPQRFGRRGSRHVEDPLVEPLWSGLRVLAHVDAGGVELLDADGEARSWPQVAEALSAGVHATSAVLDGYLTTEASGGGVGAYAGALPVESASLGGMARGMFGLGGRRNRRAELLEAFERENPQFEPHDAVAFVAVDLLALDGESFLDVPLLERKRLLDAVVDEGDLVRRGMHIRPPINTWLGTWRMLGFRSIAFKDINSRYRPGEINDDWATAFIPPR
jgi:ATP-dependent DNA ligase